MIIMIIMKMKKIYFLGKFQQNNNNNSGDVHFSFVFFVFFFFSFVFAFACLGRVMDRTLILVFIFLFATPLLAGVVRFDGQKVIYWLLALECRPCCSPLFPIICSGSSSECRIILTNGPVEGGLSDRTSKLVAARFVCAHIVLRTCLKYSRFSATLRTSGPTRVS